MYWKFHSPSSDQIDKLLQQEDVSLHQLMEEDELLQECKSQNKKLIDYLSKNEVLEELVTMIVTEPSWIIPVPSRYKRANLASELLSSDIPAIVNSLASSTELLQLLYKFFQNEKPLNPLLASFVSKLFGTFLKRRSEQNWYLYQVTCFQVIDFLKSQRDFVDLAVTHIGTSAIMDLLSNLICIVDEDDVEIKRGIHEWLDQCHLIEKLVGKLSPHCDPEEHAGVDQLFDEILPKSPENDGSVLSVISETYSSLAFQNNLLKTIESENVINLLMDTLLHEDKTSSSVSHVINVLLNLISFKRASARNSYSEVHSVGTSRDLDVSCSILEIIVNKLPELHQVLSQSPKEPILTSYGTEVEKLGTIRLKVVALISALISTNDPKVHSKMVSLKTLHLLFELFFKFPLNNFLHTLVTQCVTTVMRESLNANRPNVDTVDTSQDSPQIEENGTEEMVQDERKDGALHHTTKFSKAAANVGPLLEQLISDVGIIQKILSFYEAEDNNSPKKQLRNLVGYGGHIREMANALVECSSGDSGQMVNEEIQKLPEDVVEHWEAFKGGALARINELNKIDSVQMYKDDANITEEFQCNEEFKNADDGDAVISTNGQHLEGSDCHLDVDFDQEEGKFASMEKFQELCSQRISSSIFEEDDDARRTSYEPKIQKIRAENEGDSSSDENNDGSDGGNDSHSSSDEEIVDHLNYDEKMETDLADEWTDVFDKRGVTMSRGDAFIDSSPDFNPWQTAPASDTVGVNSWADFGPISTSTNASGNSFSNDEDLFSTPPDAFNSSGGSQTVGFGRVSSPHSDNPPPAVHFDVDFANCVSQNESGDKSFDKELTPDPGFSCDFQANFDKSPLKSPPPTSFDNRSNGTAFANSPVSMQVEVEDDNQATRMQQSESGSEPDSPASDSSYKSVEMDSTDSIKDDLANCSSSVENDLENADENSVPVLSPPGSFPVAQEADMSDDFSSSNPQTQPESNASTSSPENEEDMKDDDEDTSSGSSNLVTAVESPKSSGDEEMHDLESEDLAMDSPKSDDSVHINNEQSETVIDNSDINSSINPDAKIENDVAPLASSENDALHCEKGVSSTQVQIDSEIKANDTESASEVVMSHQDFSDTRFKLDKMAGLNQENVGNESEEMAMNDPPNSISLDREVLATSSVNKETLPQLQT